MLTFSAGSPASHQAKEKAPEARHPNGILSGAHRMAPLVRTPLATDTRAFLGWPFQRAFARRSLGSIKLEASENC